MNNYPYANGSIKSIENGILSRNKVYKLANVDKKEFVKTLFEMDYGTDPTNLETLISSEMMRTKELINSLTPDPLNIFLFFIVNDAQNIKVLYKSKVFGVSSNNIDNLLVDTGSINKNSLKKAIIYDDFSGLTKDESKLINMVKENISGIDNARLLSSKIDNTIYKFALKKSLLNSCLETYFKSLIDFTNIITLIRSRNLSWKQDKFLEMYLDGGTIKKDFFKENYEIEQNKKGEEKLLKNFVPYYNGKITEILSDYFQNKNLNRLETKFDSLLIEVMNKFKNDAFSVGPMLFYYLEKSAEAKNIRMLYASQNVDINDLLAI